MGQMWRLSGPKVTLSQMFNTPALMFIQCWGLIWCHMTPPPHFLHLHTHRTHIRRECCQLIHKHQRRIWRTQQQMTTSHVFGKRQLSTIKDQLFPYNHLYTLSTRMSTVGSQRCFPTGSWRPVLVYSLCSGRTGPVKYTRQQHKLNLEQKLKKNKK